MNQPNSISEIQQKDQFDTDLEITERLCSKSDNPDLCYDLYDKLIQKYPHHSRSWVSKAQMLTWHFTHLNIPHETFSEVCLCMEKARQIESDPHPAYEASWEHYQARYQQFDQTRDYYLNAIRSAEQEQAYLDTKKETEGSHVLFFAIFLSAVWIAAMISIALFRDTAGFIIIGSLIVTILGGVLHGLVKYRKKAHRDLQLAIQYSLPALRSEYEAFLKNESIIK